MPEDRRKAPTLQHLNTSTPVGMENFNINRRRFLQGATASLALSAFGARGMEIINRPKAVTRGIDRKFPGGMGKK